MSRRSEPGHRAGFGIHASYGPVAKLGLFLQELSPMPKKSYRDYIDKLNRLTGFSLGPVGVQWAFTEGERDKARRLIAFCEDKRVLFARHNWELKSECVTSANSIREFFTRELGDLDRTLELAKRLEIMRKACRTFLDSLRHHEMEPDRQDWGQIVNGIPRQHLETLRETFGQHLFWIMMAYELEVEDDLAQCFPPELTGR